MHTYPRGKTFSALSWHVAHNSSYLRGSDAMANQPTSGFNNMLRPNCVPHLHEAIQLPPEMIQHLLCLLPLLKLTLRVLQLLMNISERLSCLGYRRRPCPTRWWHTWRPRSKNGCSRSPSKPIILPGCTTYCSRIRLRHWTTWISSRHERIITTHYRPPVPPPVL